MLFWEGHKQKDYLKKKKKKNFNRFTRIHLEILSFQISIIFPLYAGISYKINKKKKN